MSAYQQVWLFERKFFFLFFIQKFIWSDSIRQIQRHSDCSDFQHAYDVLSRICSCRLVAMVEEFFKVLLISASLTLKVQNWEMKEQFFSHMHLLVMYTPISYSWNFQDVILEWQDCEDYLKCYKDLLLLLWRWAFLLSQVIVSAHVKNSNITVAVLHSNCQDGSGGSLHEFTVLIDDRHSVGLPM